ncbi:MAG TPA: response regulator transcription factor, partial [Flavobacteriaceae bacterium]|nr:response regulator transcription factor [Flavobacteriaceae bacterium]
MQHKILIVEDDQHISEILEINLSNEGFEVDIAFSAEEAIEKLDDSFHLILLDIMMGGMSGYKMAGKLRSENNHIPIIFLTAKNTENDMLTGFSVGGDDYISKPFSIKEVVARIQALLKRNKAISSALNEESKLNY